ncbi:iron-siderophore ABC transporter substrate-binding protein (plasmid) [Shinella sp. PSBB067]|uniref:iron-siderophore ABC transporter substrate-binding protein n=1 Tax=Shinella sp. PSBB067 TaxID=2715959 RepID=UPI00193C5155|nr:iron-siderophore ABC transporter substrate-binding protein [Shinella sp. PSBB067]QRI66612.1 iron-siderophore ABC transporter substrate-binding protein [Shinella sp. PSBB067]
MKTALCLIISALAMLLSLTPAVAQCQGRAISEHVLGAPVCVPVAPTRIVVLDPFYNLGMGLELGLPIVGAPLMTAQDTDLRMAAEKASVTDIGDARQPSLERIVALKPDLIIGDATLHAQVRGMFEKIAPTVLIDVRNWKDHLRVLADMTGRKDAAAELLDGYQARVAAIRARVPQFPVSVLRITPTGFHVYVSGPASYAPYAVLREAGVQRTAYETVTDDTAFKRPGWEEIGLLDGKILLYVVVSGYDQAPDDALEAATIKNPFWQMLPAVQAGKAHRVDRGTWMGFHGVASAHRVLDDVERYIVNAP